MNRFCYFLVFISFFIFSFHVGFSQNNRKIDSLKNQFKIAKEDSSKINTLNLLFLEYEFSDAEAAEKCAQQGLDLSQKIDYKKGLINFYTNLGFLSQDKSNSEQAKIYYIQSFKIAEELNDKKKVSASLCNIGNVYFEQCNYPKALDCFLKALKISEEVGVPQPIAARLGNIGGVYIRLQNYPKALEYYFKALKIDETLGDKNEMSPDLNNIGIIYYEKKEYIKALEFCFRALKIDEELGNKNFTASRLGNIGNIYSDMSENPKLSSSERDTLLNKSLSYYFRAKKVYEEINDKNGVAIQLGNIGSIYITTKNYKEAEQYLKKVLEIDTAIGFRDHTQNTLLLLSVLYEQTNQPIKALAFYKKYEVEKDSVFNETKSNQIAEMQTKYEVDKKEKELEILKKEQQVTGYKNSILIIVFVFVCLISILLISRQRIKISKQRQQHKMEQQLVQVELERNKLETKNLQTNLELNKEKLLSSTNLIKEKTRLLDQMQEEIEHIRQKNEGKEEPTAEQLLKTVKESIDPEQYWEEFITNFNLTYKDFMDQLMSKYPNLTRNELRFCALVKCNLGNKEIANILHISPDSVKKARNRIRKKFELEVTENLTKFILSLN